VEFVNGVSAFPKTLLVEKFLGRWIANYHITQSSLVKEPGDTDFSESLALIQWPQPVNECEKLVPLFEVFYFFSPVYLTGKLPCRGSNSVGLTGFLLVEGCWATGNS
jgi:hypothetical protein